ncbi:MobH family relaxase [Zhongshania marina]|uniref:Relaxase n=1 Tax=Zhongshania marina TaxID=2304603 RepID=A0A2S4HC52_9GAMM|nr:MobH family relaxase [Marortus luteolus]POP51582.1 relaxase [Marortus luteolus]
MLRNIFGKRVGEQASSPNTTPTTASPAGGKYHIVETGREILSRELYASKVRRVKRLTSATEEVWNRHYLSTIERFVELVQGAPASESHHHSYHGGLIEHTLEVLASGVQIAQGFMLPPNVEPEMLLHSVDKWRFGAFLAIIAHDIGKVATDIEFVYRTKGEGFTKWHPWNGPLPIGSEYTYRYKPRLANSAVGKTLHERASISLVPQLLTKEATLWVYSDVELVGQLLNTITAAPAGGGAIAEIVRMADKASVANAVGAVVNESRAHNAPLALHEKALSALRQLIDNGELKRNRPGAAVWTTETHTWVVSRVGVEAIKARLIEEGHKGIPNNPVRMFEHLQAQGITVCPESGDNIWRAEVNDLARGWKQILTFMCFENRTLWPTRTPDVFDGTIIPLDEKDQPVGMPSAEPEAAVYAQNLLSECQPIVVPDSKIVEVVDEAPLVSTNNDLPADPNPIKAPSEVQVSKPQKIGREFETKRSPLNRGEVKAKVDKDVDIAEKGRALYNDDGKPNISEKELREHVFFNWLLEGVEHRSIKVNEPKAMVHFVDDYAALVTPQVFQKFFESPVQKKKFELKAGGKPVFTVIQKEIFSLGIAHIGSKGRNIWEVTVSGGRRNSQLSVILIPRGYFPSFDKFSSNPAITLPKE